MIFYLLRQLFGLFLGVFNLAVEVFNPWLPQRQATKVITEDLRTESEASPCQNAVLQGFTTGRFQLQKWWDEENTCLICGCSQPNWEVWASQIGSFLENFGVKTIDKKNDWNHHLVDIYSPFITW